MNPALRVVREIPLYELWDGSGVLEYKRGRALDRSEIGDLLRTAGLRVVVADVGSPLRWVSGDAVFEFWRRDAKRRIVAPALASNGFRLEDFPGESAYIATRWEAAGQPPLVLLEHYH
jgi:hypothetical protein